LSKLLTVFFATFQNFLLRIQTFVKKKDFKLKYNFECSDAVLNRDNDNSLKTGIFSRLKIFTGKGKIFPKN